MSLYNDDSVKFSNQNTNSVGSEYAATYGHDVSLLVQKLTNKAIFDAKPQQFMDLKLMNMVGPDQINSDEFFYQEMGYQREPIVASGVAGSVSYPNTLTQLTLQSQLHLTQEIHFLRLRLMRLSLTFQVLTMMVLTVSLSTSVHRLLSVTTMFSCSTRLFDTMKLSFIN
jgi:hypothetical protein